MSPRPVLLYPDPALKQIAAPVQASQLDGVAAELVAAMGSYERCVGIAAPQLGLGVRVAVVDVSEHPKAETSSGLLVLANPRIVEAEGSNVAREGCLSLPDITANVRRATRVVVEHIGGTVECRGFEARAVQHGWTTWTGSCSWTGSSRWWTTSSAAAATPSRRPRPRQEGARRGTA
jgi:peptide deformylase